MRKILEGQPRVTYLEWGYNKCARTTILVCLGQKIFLGYPEVTPRVKNETRTHASHFAGRVRV